MDRRIAITCFLLACATPVRAQETEQTHAASAQVAAFAEAWNHHDMHALCRLFTADADFVNVTGAWWKGTAAIEQNHAFLHGTVAPTDTAAVSGSPLKNYGAFRNTTIAFDSIVVRAVGPAAMVARAPWRIMGDDRTAAVRTGLFIFVLRQTDGEWRIVAAQNTEVNRPGRLSRD